MVNHKIQRKHGVGPISNGTDERTEDTNSGYQLYEPIGSIQPKNGFDPHKSLPFGRCRQSGCFELDMDGRQPLTTTTTQGLRGQVVEMEPPTEEYQPYENGQHCNVDVGHVGGLNAFSLLLLNPKF